MPEVPGQQQSTATQQPAASAPPEQPPATTATEELPPMRGGRVDWSGITLAENSAPVPLRSGPRLWLLGLILVILAGVGYGVVRALKPDPSAADAAPMRRGRDFLSDRVHSGRQGVGMAQDVQAKRRQHAEDMQKAIDGEDGSLPPSRGD